MSKEPGSSIRDRTAYIPIHKRPRLRLPGNARVAVWTIVNVEDWVGRAPMPRTVLPPPMGSRCCPTCRTGPGTSTACASASGASSSAAAASSRRRSRSTVRSASSTARPAQAALDAGWEFMGHGYVQRPMHKSRTSARRSATRSKRSATSPASRRAAGRARASPRPTRRSTCWPKPASSTSPTGCSTTSRLRSRPRAGRSSRCPTRSR